MTKRTEIDFGFIDRTLKTTCLVLLIFFPFGIYYMGFFPALAILSAGIWAMLNLILITMLVKYTLRPEGPDTGRAIAAAFIKFPLLYLGGYFLLKVPQFDPLHLLIGFSGLLLIIVLKILGGGLVGMVRDSDKKQEGEGVSAK